MKDAPDFLLRFVLIVLLCLAWLLVGSATLSPTQNILLLTILPLLGYPCVALGRKLLDRNPTPRNALRMTALVQFGIGLTLITPLVRICIDTPPTPGMGFSLSPLLSQALLLISGTASLLTVLTLALRGWGAPFFIALSQRLAVDWLYARTRNPMVLAALVFLLCLGLSLGSVSFLLWVLLFFAPALLFFVRRFEERELELRFGTAYEQYRAKTPFLLPRLHGR